MTGSCQVIEEYGAVCFFSERALVCEKDLVSILPDSAVLCASVDSLFFLFDGSEP